MKTTQFPDLIKISILSYEYRNNKKLKHLTSEFILSLFIKNWHSLKYEYNVIVENCKNLDTCCCSNNKICSHRIGTFLCDIANWVDGKITICNSYKIIDLNPALYLIGKDHYIYYFNEKFKTKKIIPEKYKIFN